MNTTITRRAWVYLAAMLGGVALATVALPLAWRARADHGRIDRLANDDLVLATSVADARLLAVQMQLGVTRAVLFPDERAEAGRFAANRSLITDDLRRARLHARDHNTVDVVDDLDNRTLAFAESAEKVYESLAAGKTDEARSILARLTSDGAEVNALADELYTVATASADARARALNGGLSSTSMLALALAGVVFAVLAGTLAWGESAAAIVSLLALVLPYPVVRRLVSETESKGAEQQATIASPHAFPQSGEDEPAADQGMSDRAGDGEKMDAPPSGLAASSNEARAQPILAEREQTTFQRMDEIGPQPARTVTFNDEYGAAGASQDAEEDDEPRPIWRPRTMQKPAGEVA